MRNQRDIPEFESGSDESPRESEQEIGQADEFAEDDTDEESDFDEDKEDAN